MELEKASSIFSSRYYPCMKITSIVLLCVCITQAAWHGELAALSVFGDGKNVLPTIHISDLAR